MVLDDILDRVSTARKEAIDNATQTLLRQQKVLPDDQSYTVENVTKQLNNLGYFLTIEDKHDQIITVKLEKRITIAQVACKFTYDF